MLTLTLVRYFRSLGEILTLPGVARRKSWSWMLFLLLLLVLSGCDDGTVSGALVWEGRHVYDEGDVVQGHLVVAVLAYLTARFLGRPLARVRRASADHPIVAGAMGLLVAIVGPSLLVLMAFTIILLPVTLTALLLTGVIVVYAWIGLGAALGQWLRDVLNRDWSAPVSAFAGTFLFMAVTDLLALIPFVGGWIGILATAVGVGAIFLTRFGLREFVPTYDFGPPQESAV